MVLTPGLHLLEEFVPSALLGDGDLKSRLHQNFNFPGGCAGVLRMQKLMQCCLVRVQNFKRFLFIHTWNMSKDGFECSVYCQEFYPVLNFPGTFSFIFSELFSSVK